MSWRSHSAVRELPLGFSQGYDWESGEFAARFVRFSRLRTTNVDGVRTAE